jgi:DNA-binding NarL/FixJ family response regulator
VAEPIRILIADDDQLVRAGIRLILAAHHDLEIVGEAPNGREAVELTVRHRPRIVLLDIQMPVMDGLSALREILRTAPGTHVVMLTTFGEDAYLTEALADGAAGFLLKDSAADDLAPAVRAVARGEAFLSPAVTRRVLDTFNPGDASRSVRAAARLEVLSDREREVLVLLGQGMSNADIGERLWIAEATVKTHVSRVLTKLGCENRVQAALLAHDAGLIRPAE